MYMRGGSEGPKKPEGPGEGSEGREYAETLIKQSLPGIEHERMVMGNLEANSGRPINAHVAAVSRLSENPGNGENLENLETWYTTLLRLHEPEEGEQEGEQEGEKEGEKDDDGNGNNGKVGGIPSKVPRQFPGVPPVPEGVVVLFQRAQEDPVMAGEDYGFIKTSLLQEAVDPEDRLTGLQRLEHWIADYKRRTLFERLYSNPELTRDPEYRAELESQIEEVVPDAEEREMLHSLYAFKHGIDRDQETNQETNQETDQRENRQG